MAAKEFINQMRQQGHNWHERVQSNIAKTLDQAQQSKPAVCPCANTIDT